ncbi:hypothetical protein [Pseudoalteromonas sp. 120-MNA-CIBAN-0494]|uniref:hypothetical protein n=1 Tax=unclassified Pseudoalteromonas TaxID=194690 RepID=UPI0033167A5D
MNIIATDEDKVKALSKYVLFIFPFFIWAIEGVIFYFSPESKFIWQFTLLINLIYLFKFSRCIPVFILFAFFLMYSFEPYNFFVNELYISYWMDFQSAYYLNKVSVISGLFFIMLGSFLFNISEKNMVNITYVRQPDKLLFLFTVVLFFICTHFGMSGDTVLTAGYGASERDKSPLFEYAMIFLILALFFSNDSKVHKVIATLMVIFFSLKTVLYGGRIEVIQIVLAFMYFKTNFFRSWSLKKLYVSIILAFMLLLIVGRIRTNPLLIFGLIENPMVLFDFSPISKTGTVSSNYGDVQQSSARMLGLVDTGFWGLEFRIKSSISYLFNLFLYGNELKHASNIALIDQDKFGTGGGGLIGSQFYVWLSWLGPILSGIFIGGIIRKGLKPNSKKVFFIYAFTLLITFPRWYAYGPLALVKFALITAILYCLLFGFSLFVRKK